jgi:hypothetical protein
MAGQDEAARGQPTSEEPPAGEKIKRKCSHKKS